MYVDTTHEQTEAERLGSDAGVGLELSLSLFKKSLHSCFYTNFKIRENTKPLLKPGGIIAMEPLY